MSEREIRNLLAIRFARLGDVILLLPALSALKRALPNTRLTILTGHRCAPLAAMSPAIDEVLSVDRVAMRDGSKWAALGEMRQLVSTIRGRHFDAVIDFHSFRETNLLAWLSAAPVRIGMQRRNQPFLQFCFNRAPILEDKGVHVSEMFLRVADALVPVSNAIGPTLNIPADVREWVTRLLPDKPRLALYVDAPVPDRRWPAECFAAVADYAIEKFAARPMILSSPEGRSLAVKAQQASRHPDEIVVFSDLKLPDLAGVIGSARMLISNDTGPMHLGPALGVDTLGLFSVGFPLHFRPIGPNDAYIHGRPIEDISVETVIGEMSRMWVIGAGPGLQR